MRRGSLAGAALLAATLVHAQAPTPARLVVPSGTIVDGQGLAHFREPRHAGNGRIAFRATTERLITTEGESTRVLLTSGAALPAPLQGTLNAFVRVRSTSGGLVVFQAELNGPDVDEGIFALDGDRLTTIATGRSAAGTEAIHALELNESGTALFALDDGIYRWTREGGSERIVALGITAVHSPVIDADGAAAWATDTAVFHWSPSSGLTTIAEVGQASPYGGMYTGFRRTDVAIEASNGVAFLANTGSTDGAFVWSSTTGTTSVVMRVGDSVNGNAIERFERRIFLSGGQVVVWARVDRRRRYVARSAGGIGLIFVARPPRVPGGSATSASIEGLYVLDGKAVRLIARQGEPVGDVGSVSTIGSFVARGDTVVFWVDTAEETGVLLRYRRGRIARIVKVGDTLPGPVEVTFIGAFDAANDTVVFHGGSDVIVLRSGRLPRTIRGPRTLTAAADVFVDRLFLSGSSIVMAAFADAPTAGGIYVAKGRRFLPYLEIGDTVPGFDDARVTSFWGVDIDGRRRLFAVELVGGAIQLFLANEVRVVRLPLDDPGVAGSQLVPRLMSLDGRTVLVSDGEAVYQATRRGLRPVVQTGDTTEAGVLTFSGEDPRFGRAAFTAAGRAVVFASDLDGGAARSGLLVRSVLGTSPIQ